MKTKPKIKIIDDSELRGTLDCVYGEATDSAIAEWSVELAKRALSQAEIVWESIDAVREGFRLNELRRTGLVRAHDVRAAGFRIHELAKTAESESIRAAYRVAAHAVGTGHMREHAMVASDYAVKLVNLKFPDDDNAVCRERLFQIELLKAIAANSSGEQLVKIAK